MKIAGIASLVVAALILGLWAAHGADLATRETVPITTEVVDDFGDKVEKIEWKTPTGYPLTGFHLGLDRTGPLAGGAGMLGVLLLILGSGKKDDKNDNGEPA